MVEGKSFRLADRITVKVARVDLETTKIDFVLVDGEADAAAQYVELNFDAEQCLQDSIVQITGDAAALAFDGARANVT